MGTRLDCELEGSDTQPDQIDPERQRKAKEYARIRRRLFLVNLVLGLIALLILLFTGLSVALADLGQSLIHWRWGVIAFYFVVVGEGFSLLTSPLDYYSGFVLPHRYGLSIQSLRAWLLDQLKSSLLGGLLGLVVIEVVYYLLEAWPTLWWLLAAAVMLFFTVVMANLAPILILPIFNKFTPLEDAELRDRLIKLAERAGAKVRGVFVMDTSRRSTTANAALMGWGNTRRIVLSDTLFGKYSKDEIEVILAHELGHHVHQDIWRGILVQTVLTLGGLYLADRALNFGVELFSLGSMANVAAFPLLGLVFAVFGLVVMPLGNWFSRRQESAADTYALEMTRLPRAFVSAMSKLADQNLSELDPDRWVVWLFYSHPPIGERVEHGEQFERAHTS